MKFVQVKVEMKVLKDYYGNTTVKEYEAAKEANPWFDWENFDPK